MNQRFPEYNLVRRMSRDMLLRPWCSPCVAGIDVLFHPQGTCLGISIICCCFLDLCIFTIRFRFRTISKCSPIFNDNKKSLSLFASSGLNRVLAYCSCPIRLCSSVTCSGFMPDSSLPVIPWISLTDPHLFQLV